MADLQNILTDLRDELSCSLKYSRTLARKIVKWFPQEKTQLEELLTHDAGTSKTYPVKKGPESPITIDDCTMRNIALAEMPEVQKSHEKYLRKLEKTKLNKKPRCNVKDVVMENIDYDILHDEVKNKSLIETNVREFLTKELKPYIDDIKKMRNFSDTILDKKNPDEEEQLTAEHNMRELLTKEINTVGEERPNNLYKEPNDMTEQKNLISDMLTQMEKDQEELQEEINKRRELLEKSTQQLETQLTTDEVEAKKTVDDMVDVIADEPVDEQLPTVDEIPINRLSKYSSTEQEKIIFNLFLKAKANIEHMTKDQEMSNDEKNSLINREADRLLENYLAGV